MRNIGTRLVTEENGREIPVPDSGTSAQFTNGIDMVEYEVSPIVSHWRRGDPVHLCLVKLPRNCPPGDERGKVYRATDLRTRTSWKAPDAEHMCGGA